MQVLVHIGCAKGGSSAVQEFLATNVDALSEAGYCVPTSDLTAQTEISGNQIEYFQSLSQAPVEDAADSLRRRIEGTVKMNPSAKCILLSAENLCNPVGFEKVFATLLDEYDIRVLMYVRRQDDYISSAWQQWYVKSGVSLTAWLSENIGVIANWHSYMKPWQEELGAGRVEVRRYGKDYFRNGSIFDDYCNFIDPALDVAALETPQHLVNQSLNADVSRWVEGRDDFFKGPHDNEYYGYLYQMGGPSLIDKQAAPPLFTVDEEVAIMRRYAHSNEQVRQTFLADSERPLFRINKAKAPAPVFERNDVQRRLAAMETQLYRMYSTLRNGEVQQ